MRVVPPALAVIVIDVALVVCHESVTLCPLLMALLLAENVRVGEPDPGFPTPCDPQPMNIVRVISAAMTKQERRMQRDFIELSPGQNIYADGIPSCRPELLLTIIASGRECVFSCSDGQEGLSLLKSDENSTQETGASPEDLGRIGYSSQAALNDAATLFRPADAMKNQQAPPSRSKLPAVKLPCRSLLLISYRCSSFSARICRNHAPHW